MNSELQREQKEASGREEQTGTPDVQRCDQTGSMPLMPLVAVAPLADVPENGNKAFAVRDRSILLCRSSLGVFAVENMCSHAQSALEGGKVRGAHIFCPLHGVRFDLRSGAPTGQMTKKPICAFETSVVDGIVHVELPAP